MSKKYYNLEDDFVPNAEPARNIAVALYAIANELRELRLVVKDLPVGAIVGALDAASHDIASAIESSSSSPSPE